MTPESKSAEPVTGGFVAGTLVHTELGLVPIEQIRVVWVHNINRR